MWKGKQIIPAAWVAEATARQTSNGSAPNERLGSGLRLSVLAVAPRLPRRRCVRAVHAHPAAVRRRRRDHERRARHAGGDEPRVGQAAPRDAAARGRRERRGAARAQERSWPASPCASRRDRRRRRSRRSVSGRWYQLPENDRGMRAVSLDFSGRAGAARAYRRRGVDARRSGWASGRPARDSRTAWIVC